MKKFFIVLLCIMIALSASSCQNAPDNVNEKLNIVCTVFPQYDFIRQIAGDKVNLSLLLPPGSEAHSYEPTPEDVIKLKNADLLVATGGESEHWVIHLLNGEELKTTPVIYLMDTVTKHIAEHTGVMENITHSHAHNHSKDCEHPDEEYDEHIWTTPSNAILMCREICNNLKMIDKENSLYYQTNADNYIKKLQNLSDGFIEAAKNAKRNSLVFGDRFPFLYMTEELSLEYFAAFPGCSSKTEPSAATLVFLTEKIKTEKIPAIFYVDYSDGRIAKAIAKECNIKVLRMYSCHSLSRQDFTNGETYLSLMERNLKSIKEALN